jgi:hypothetical protein
VVAIYYMLFSDCFWLFALHSFTPSSPHCPSLPTHSLFLHSPSPSVSLGVLGLLCGTGPLLRPWRCPRRFLGTTDTVSHATHRCYTVTVAADATSVRTATVIANDISIAVSSMLLLLLLLLSSFSIFLELSFSRHHCYCYCYCYCY